MTYKGRVKGNIIELDAPVPFENGTEVTVTLTPTEKPEKGSPQAWLQIAGTLTEEEAEEMLRAIHKEFRQVEPEFWSAEQA